MKTRICVWAISAVFSILPYLGVAQQYQRLTAGDFAGIPPTNQSFIAYTHCDVNYSYNAVKHNGNYAIGFNVEVLFNPYKSWIRFEQVKDATTLQNILKHEQGHYNIAWLMRGELYWVLTHHHYTANYQTEIDALFDEVHAKYSKMNDDYETETEHMSRAKNQAKWNVWFDKHLGGTEIAEVGGRNKFQ